MLHPVHILVTIAVVLFALVCFGMAFGWVSRIRGWFATFDLSIPQDNSCPTATVNGKPVELSFNPNWTRRGDSSLTDAVVTSIITEVYIGTGLRLPRAKVQTTVASELRRNAVAAIRDTATRTPRTFPPVRREPVKLEPMPRRYTAPTAPANPQVHGTDPTDNTATNLLLVSMLLNDSACKHATATHEAVPIPTHNVEPITTHETNHHHTHSTHDYGSADSSSSCDSGSSSSDGGSCGGCD